MRERNTSRLKNACEYFWAFGPFREAVGQESITNNQSKEGLRVGRKPHPCLPPSHYFRRETSHFFPPIPDTSFDCTYYPELDRTSSSMSAPLLEARNGPTRRQPNLK